MRLLAAGRGLRLPQLHERPAARHISHRQRGLREEGREVERHMGVQHVAGPGGLEGQGQAVELFGHLLRQGAWR